MVRGRTAVLPRPARQLVLPRPNVPAEKRGGGHHWGTRFSGEEHGVRSELEDILHGIRHRSGLFISFFVTRDMVGLTRVEYV